MERKNRLHVYTGDGKGKSTAAMGLAARSAGHGRQVLVVQFMKPGTSGELKSLRMLPTVEVYEGVPVTMFTNQMDEEDFERTRQNQTAELKRIGEKIMALKPALIVLDELAVAMSYRLVPQDEALALIEQALQVGEVVVTGRGASDRLMDMADYVSVIEARKHPYDSEDHLPARKGIEW